MPEKHIDTGAGLERIVTVLQDKKSNYETDLFQPIIKGIETITGSKYLNDKVPHHVISDHIRMLSFAIADGAMPSNEGRGYVLRRILRRASRFGRMLGTKEPFLFKLVDYLIDVMGESFPELVEKKIHIEKVIESEESSFNSTLERGLSHFEKYISKHKGNAIPGKEAFKLYDTYGFPLDLTQLMAREQGLEVDEIGFHDNMKKQRDRAKASGNFKQVSSDLSWVVISDSKDSIFLGYEQIESQSQICKYAITDDYTVLVLDKTPFYAESGGQIGDTGVIKIGDDTLTVMDCQKNGDEIHHICSGSFNNEKLLEPVLCIIDLNRRQRIRKNHTATHLLHAALKKTLGDHIQQAGSLVHPDYLRFDLTHSEKISNDEVSEIENLVNDEIQKNVRLDISIKNFDIAKSEGAEALFGEKYGDKVRVISIGDFSMELCGGTHVNRTGDIGLLKITEESSLAAGVRRMVAVTGPEAINYFQNKVSIVQELQVILGAKSDEISSRVSHLIDERKVLEKKLKQKRSSSAFNAKVIMEDALKVNEHNIIVSEVDSESLDELKRFGDQTLNVLESGIAVLGSNKGAKPAAVIVVTDDIIKKGLNAGSLAKLVGNEMGGGGGGKPSLATAGGKDLKSYTIAMKKSIDLIKSELKKVEGD